MFAELEDQLCCFAPGSTNSPDRLDALVYALTELMVAGVRRPMRISDAALAAARQRGPSYRGFSH
jgi:phage terminase large subunit-like protein